MTPVGTALSRRDSTGAQPEDVSGPEACYSERKRSIIDRERGSGGLPRIVNVKDVFNLHLEQSGVWLSKEQRDVPCRLTRRGRNAANVTFVVDEDETGQSVFGSVPCAVFQTAVDGTVMVPIINLSQFGLAADQGEWLFAVRQLNLQEIFAPETLSEEQRHDAQQHFTEAERRLLRLREEWHARDARNEEPRSWLHFFRGEEEASTGGPLRTHTFRRSRQSRKVKREQRAGARAMHVQEACLLYTSPSPRDKRQSRMPSSA